MCDTAQREQTTEHCEFCQEGAPLTHLAKTGPVSQFALGDKIRVKSGYGGRYGPHKQVVSSYWGYIVAGRHRAGSSEEYEFRIKMPRINCEPKKLLGSGPCTYDEVMAAPEQWECWISESALDKFEGSTTDWQPKVETSAEKPCHTVLAAQGFKIGSKVSLKRTVVVPGHDSILQGYFGYIKTFSVTGTHARLIVPGDNVKWDGHRSFAHYEPLALRYIIEVPLNDLAVWT